MFVRRQDCFQQGDNGCCGLGRRRLCSDRAASSRALAQAPAAATSDPLRVPRRSWKFGAERDQPGRDAKEIFDAMVYFAQQDFLLRPRMFDAG